MAGIGFQAATGNIATGTAAKTLVQIIAAANHRVLIKQVSVCFRGTSNSDAPVLIQILRQTNAGTMSSQTLTKQSPGDDETLQTTATHTATGEPGSGDLVQSYAIHPQQGMIWQHTFGDPIIVPGGTRLGVVVTAGADVNAVVTILGEE